MTSTARDRPDLSRLTLLVVDDNDQMRTIIGAVLAGAGVRNLHFAPDGRHGLASLAANEIDVAFVDYEMPVMHGLDFISAVRGMAGDKRFLPIIMLTGHSDLKRLNAARDRGVTEFLAKPVSARTILKRLETVIYHPRPFAQSPTFFGPDRRRRADVNYRGPRRRASDSTPVFEL